MPFTAKKGNFSLALWGEGVRRTGEGLNIKNGKERWRTNANDEAVLRVQVTAS